MRSLSKRARDAAGRRSTSTARYEVDYEPGESTTGLFGGNSNWRGPVWFPVNYLMIEALQKYHHYYGDDFTVECPTGLRAACDLWRGRRRARHAGSIALFVRGADGRRPVERRRTTC